MFSACGACATGGGSCSKHPRVSCGECGIEYTDDEDWSGPPHNQRNCIVELRRQCETLRRSRAEVLIRLAFLRGALSDEDEVDTYAGRQRLIDLTAISLDISDDEWSKAKRAFDDEVFASLTNKTA